MSDTIEPVAMTRGSSKQDREQREQDQCRRLETDPYRRASDGVNFRPSLTDQALAAERVERAEPRGWSSWA